MQRMTTAPTQNGNLRPVLMAVLASGMKQAEIARRLNLSRASINGAARPSDRPWMPSYETGVLLMQLHDEVVSAKQAA